MADGSPLHRSPRFPIVLPVLFRTADAAPRSGKGRSCSLSDGGACLELAESLAPGTLLDVTLQTDEGGLTMEAEVVWVGRRGSAGRGTLHGIRFTGLIPEQKRAVRRVIQRLGRLPQDASRVPVRLPARCRPAAGTGVPVQGWTEDIGQEGLSVSLPQRFPVGSVIEIALPTPRGAYTTEATVVWVDPASTGPHTRHGVQFGPLIWVRELILALSSGELPVGRPAGPRPGGEPDQQEGP